MKSQGPPGPRPKPRPPKVRERSSLQTKVRGVSERVKLLEDILVAYMKAHGDLIKYLTVPRNRDRLRAAASGGMGADKAVQILDNAFREVDRAAARNRAMLKRMNEINDEETGATTPGEEFHKDSVVLPSYPPLKDADGKPLAPVAQDEMEHVRRTQELFEVPKEVNPIVEEFVEGLEASKKHITATVQDILNLKKAEIAGVEAYDAAQKDRKEAKSDEKPVTSTENDPDSTENGPDSAEKPADSPSVRAFKDSMIGKEP